MRGSWAGRPVLLVPLPSQVGRNLTATRRCGSTTPANPSDGRSGYCAPPASGQHPGNQHGKTKEERRAHNRKTSPTPLPRELERDARGQSGEGWVTRRSGLLALWPLGCGTGQGTPSRAFLSCLSQLVVFKPLNDRESPTHHDTP